MKRWAVARLIPMWMVIKSTPSCACISTIFNHSAVPALNQLMLPFLSLVTESELHRNPTVKAEIALRGFAEGAAEGEAVA